MVFGGSPAKIRWLAFVLVILLVSSLFLSCSLAMAKPATESSNEFNYDPPSVPGTALGFIYTLLRLIISLVLVFALFFGAVYLFKKFSFSNFSQTQSSESSAKLIGTVSLGGGRFVHLVKISENVLVIGAADGGVSLLREMEPEEARELIELYEAKGIATMEPFEATLFRLYSGWQKPVIEKSRRVSRGVINDVKDRIEIWKQRTVRK